MRKIILVLISSVGVIFGINAQDFDSLTASGSNKKIEWTTSNWSSGFGHKIYSFDPGGRTLLNIAARNNTSSWTDLMTFSSDGKVGIGTNNPNFKLHIKSTNNQLMRFTSTHGTWLDFESTNAPTGSRIWSIGHQGVLGKFGIYQRDGISKYRFMIDSQGNVGIGTSSPTVKLDVNGPVKFDNKAAMHTSLQIGHDVYDRIISDNSTNKHYGGGMFFRVSPNPASPTGSNYIDVMMLTDYGNVGIGTRTTGPHKLAVEGSIGAREVKVLASGWADFVFYKDYKLPTLKEVEAHIKEKGHLQDIPSAKEVQENGIFLGEMNAKLLQKIEELMLYTLAQEKKLTHQEKEITTLKEQFIQLEKTIKNN